MLLMALVTLFALGMFLGNISKDNLLLSGVKTVTAGVVSIVLSYFLD